MTLLIIRCPEAVDAAAIATAGFPPFHLKTAAGRGQEGAKSRGWKWKLWGTFEKAELT